MKLTQKITLALGLLAAAGTSFAQINASNGTGLLGQRYLDIGVGLQDVEHLSDHVYGASAVVNFPLAPNLLDGGLSYNYSRIRGIVHGDANAFAANLRLYTPLQGVKPFVGADVGWQWVRIRHGGDDDYGIWNLVAGVEIPAGPLTITPRVVYADDFENKRDSSHEWTYEAEANYWFTPKTAGYASIGKTDGQVGSLDSWNYRVGVRFKF